MTGSPRRAGDLRGPVLLPGLLVWFVLVALWLAWAPYQFLFDGNPMGWFVGRSPVRIFPETSLVDLVGNLGLLVPLGVGVALWGWRRPIAVALAVGTLVSVGIELGQLFLPERIVSLTDVLLNATGAGMGAAGALWLGRRLGARRVLGATAAVVYAGVLGYALYAGEVFRREQRLEGWDARYEIAAGRDADGDMPYVGRVWDARICAGSGAERVCAAPGASREERERLVRVAEGTQVVDATVRVLSASDSQTGPTRIVTFSPHAWRTNLAICQWRTLLNVRFRTPLMGPNGEAYELWIPDAVHEGVPTEIRTRFRGTTVETEIVSGGTTRLVTHTFDALSSGLLFNGVMLGVMPAEVRLARGLTAVILALPLLLAPAAYARRRRAGGRARNRTAPPPSRAPRRPPRG